jgi:eukaryotic-like serine/threonine-protein kinase
MLRKILSSSVPALVAFGLLGSAGAQPSREPARKAPPRGGVSGRLTWFDRQGRIVGTLGESGMYRTLTISPDGRRVAVERTDPQTQNRDIWLVDIGSGAFTRFTTDPAWDAFPTWYPDGSRIIFTSNRSGVYDLYEKPSSGAGGATLFYRNTEGKGPTSWSPDGKFLLYYSLGQPTHVRLLSVDGLANRRPVPLVDPQFISITARFSPDGRWIAYTSNESGRNEISARSFDSATGSAGAPVTVTSDGGRTPLWRGDGRELFYFSAEGMVMAAEVKSGAAFQAGPPKPLFPAPAGVLFWDVSPDGQRFLMPSPGR